MEPPHREPARPTVSAVILARNRQRTLETVLDRLATLNIDEVLVVDNGSEDGTAAAVRRRGGNVRLIEMGRNAGIAGRNAAAREAKGEFLLNLDDDSYPLPGAIEALLDVFARQPHLGVAGGLVRDVDSEGRRIREDEVGTFDWFFRAGRRAGVPPDGVPTFFFPEGASMTRRRAHLEAGGYFEPYFLGAVEVDLATRMLALGWEVRYVPAARFEHMKAQEGRSPARFLRFAVRNQLWYFWLRFPAALAARRMPAYLAFDLLLCLRHRALSSWWGGIRDAWQQRDLVRGERRPLPRAVIRRAELNRGRIHLRLLAAQLQRRLPVGGGR